MIYRLRAMNSANPTGKEKDYDGATTTVGDVISDSDMSGILVGNTYQLNGNTVTANDYSKTLDQMGLNTQSTNYLVAVKAANGAC